ncbi:hypothetical protein [Spiroplasma endosymbiont of Atherix ibis]|uniref:hypothetical protein n=1 Tax=Spiroplasma endosymbiont of Atherix ibis TaxID=3066291 RepID=UPI0030D16B2E
MRNMAFGQVYYNYDMFKKNSKQNLKEVTNNYLLETTPIWNLLKDINQSVLDNQNSIKDNNSNLIPSIFVKNLNSYYGKSINTVDMNINNFIKEISLKLPQYSTVFNFINNYYNKYKTIIISESKSIGKAFNSKEAIYHGIMDTPLAYELDKHNKNKIHFYSWKKFYESENQTQNNSPNDYFCFLTLNGSDKKPISVYDTN